MPTKAVVAWYLPMDGSEQMGHAGHPHRGALARPSRSSGASVRPTRRAMECVCGGSPVHHDGVARTARHHHEAGGARRAAGRGEAAVASQADAPVREPRPGATLRYATACETIEEEVNARPRSRGHTAAPLLRPEKAEEESVRSVARNSPEEGPHNVCNGQTEASPS